MLGEETSRSSDGLIGFGCLRIGQGMEQFWKRGLLQIQIKFKSESWSFVQGDTAKVKASYFSVCHCQPPLQGDDVEIRPSAGRPDHDDWSWHTPKVASGHRSGAAILLIVFEKSFPR